MTRLPFLAGRHHKQPMQKSSEEKNNDIVAMKVFNSTKGWSYTCTEQLHFRLALIWI